MVTRRALGVLALAVADFSVPVGVIYTAYLTLADGCMAVLAASTGFRAPLTEDAAVVPGPEAPVRLPGGSRTPGR